MSHPIPTREYGVDEYESHSPHKDEPGVRGTAKHKALLRAKGNKFGTVGKLFKQLKSVKGENHLDRLKRLTK